MKNKYILLMCIGLTLAYSNMFAGDLKEALSNLEVRITKLSKSLSIEDIQQILQEAYSLRKKAESSNISEEETKVLELEEDCMFLNIAKQYLEKPTEESAEALQEWGECKPHLKPIVDKVLER